MYFRDTHGFRITVEPEFISEEYSGGHHYFIYSYTVTIENNSKNPCQLLSRHWIIRDGTGNEEHVIGDGVVGKQPIIRPGETFSYTSGCPLTTPTGNMRGKYYMVGPKNREFEIKIPLFFLRPDDDETASPPASFEETRLH
ncbi:Co2+/Mg2+ efflux protein ApaG [Pseudobacteriovorax antillogorgiicola]|uniref:ApaG protein n=1 Tax=Pseudobacteriovorax antillogorgiicola TaxID=1513793 RepID=A0A1Y6C9F6_9BACT|nr:Co2+/Mg2+ efflux protein ApaG [Pseudobacteriovorax antillogorgiicola]TCS51718.1 ApaG protein [Pseudobacteriovorax antillogorgiicola]SMF49404.1 ApaG protein [Pseudobacteriovorax antillogorgiicola]